MQFQIQKGKKELYILREYYGHFSLLLTLVLLDCLCLFFSHAKLELPTQSPTSNDKKCLWKIDISNVELLD